MDERTGVDRGPRFRWDAPVPEYDAFGREIGENTLSGLGSDAPPAQPTPQPRPVPAPAQEWPETTIPRPEPEPAPATPPQVTFSLPEGAPVTVMPGRRRRTSGIGCLVALLILGAVVAAPVIAIFSFVGSASDVIDDVTDAIDSETLDIPEVTPPDEAAPPPTGITGKSMIAKDNLADALRRLRKEDARRLGLVRLAPERLDVTAIRGSKQRLMQVRADGELIRFDPTPGASPRTLALSVLDPAAPARLVQGSAKRYRVNPKGIDYLVASPSVEGGHGWVAYFKNGTYIQGDARGRVVRRIN
jgi:hypothetical protein